MGQLWQAKLAEQKEAFEIQSEEKLRSVLQESHDDWKKKSASELERSLAFWRNTWEAEKGRAVDEAIAKAKQDTMKSIQAKVQTRILQAQGEWRAEAKRMREVLEQKLSSAVLEATEQLRSQHAAE